MYSTTVELPARRGSAGSVPTMPSGDSRPVVTAVFGGRIGSAVIASPVAPSAARRLVVVQSSSFVVGLALDCVQ